MSQRQTPTIEEWIEYCFTQGYTDIMWSHRKAGYAKAVDRLTRYETIGPTVLTRYLTKLFSDPAPLADRYTDHQIANATQFIFGSVTQFFFDVCDARVPVESQVTCLRSIETLYTELYDRVCCWRGRCPDDQMIEEELDAAVRWIWDMSSITVAFMGPQPERQGVREAGFETLQGILLNCRTATCLQSALHGLAQLHADHPTRVRTIVDEFLSRRAPVRWLRRKARDAMKGRYC